MRIGLAVLLMMAWAPLPAQRALPSRAEIAAVEENLYNKLNAFDMNAPVDVLGLPRGLYLPGYGAVFTAELNLARAGNITPFRPRVTPEEVVQIREAKLKKLPALRDMMRQMLVDSAMSLDRVPATEQVVIGFVLAHHSWEDRKGLPQVITMHAPRQALVDAGARRTAPAALAAAVRVREE
jgi:hypothetical protein